MTDQETKALEIYNETLENLTVGDMSEHLGIQPDQLADMLSNQKNDEIDELILSSFKNYWDQSSEDDKQAYLAGY